MSHPQPPQRLPTNDETARYAQTLHYTALVTAVACPLLALLPPRKFDFYTFGLAGTTLFSANWLVRERTGRSVWQNIGIVGNDQSVDQAEESTTSLERKLQDSRQEVQRLEREHKPSVTEQVQSQREKWKREQQREVEEQIEEGKGLGDMITDQIYEVWNWRKRGGDDE